MFEVHLKVRLIATQLQLGTRPKIDAISDVKNVRGHFGRVEVYLNFNTPRKIRKCAKRLKRSKL